MLVPLKYKKGITITDAFQKKLNEYKCKSNKIWFEKYSEFYNQSLKSWLEKNDIEMYSHKMKENMMLPKDSLEP